MYSRVTKKKTPRTIHVRIRPDNIRNVITNNRSYSKKSTKSDSSKKTSHWSQSSSYNTIQSINSNKIYSSVTKKLLIRNSNH